MQDRLRAARSAASRLADRAKNLRPGAGDDDIEVVDDDDEEDEELPRLEISDEAHEELGRLDEEEAAPIEIDKDQSFFDLLRKVDPTPPVPLTGVHEAGLVALLHRLGELADTSLLEDKRARRVLDLIGDRLSISVGPDGITVRSLLRRRHTPWKRVQAITVESRYDLVRGDGLAKMTDSLKSAVMPFPIPGLSWLIRRVTNGIANWLEQRMMTDDQVERMRGGGGNVVLGIKRRGRDIELDGPLFVLVMLAPGVSDAIEQEARARGIQVDVEVSGG